MKFLKLKDRIHLKNLLALDQAGAHILPASPGFYSGQKTLEDLVDFVVARILDQLDVDQDLMGPYQGWYQMRLILT